MPFTTERIDKKKALQKMSSFVMSVGLSVFVSYMSLFRDEDLANEFNNFVVRHHVSSYVHSWNEFHYHDSVGSDNELQLQNKISKFFYSTDMRRLRKRLLQHVLPLLDQHTFIDKEDDLVDTILLAMFSNVVQALFLWSYWVMPTLKHRVIALRHYSFKI